MSLRGSNSRIDADCSCPSGLNPRVGRLVDEGVGHQRSVLPGLRGRHALSEQVRRFDALQVLP